MIASRESLSAMNKAATSALLGNLRTIIWKTAADVRKQPKATDGKRLIDMSPGKESDDIWHATIVSVLLPTKVTSSYKDGRRCASLLGHDGVSLARLLRVAGPATGGIVSCHRISWSG